MKVFKTWSIPQNVQLLWDKSLFKSSSAMEIGAVVEMQTV